MGQAMFTVYPEKAIAVAKQVLEDLEGLSKPDACAGAALAAVMLFRGSRTVEQDMDLLNELFHWLSAQHPEGETN